MSIAFCTVIKNFIVHRVVFRAPSRKQMMAAAWNASTTMIAGAITVPVADAAKAAASTVSNVNNTPQ